MLREQVLREWNGCKERVINFKKVVEFISERLLDLPSFPLGYESARRNLDFWTSNANFLMRLDQGKKEVIELMNSITISSESLEMLSVAYYNSFGMFKELAEGWKKEIDNHSGSTVIEPSGPTIEEWSD